MSEEFYKVLHFASLFFFAGGLGAMFFSEKPTKAMKILTGVSSFLILVAGMGLIKHLGISHGEGFPGWINAKIGLWVVLAAAGPILTKRFKGNPVKIYVPLLLVMVVIAYLAVNKPF